MGEQGRAGRTVAALGVGRRGARVPPAAVALGPAELIEEVSEGKITGEEDRYSHTDLSDLDANVDDSRKLFELLTPALQAKDAALASGIAAGFAAVDKRLAPYANGDGTFDPYTALTAMTDDRAAAEQPGRLGRRAFLGSAATSRASTPRRPGSACWPRSTWSPRNGAAWPGPCAT